VILKLRNQFLDRQIASLTQRASRTDISEAEKIGSLHEQQRLREQKRAPLSQLEN
jgi:phage terminase large subunit-like protein